MILSDGVWRRAFGADPQILGRTIALNDTLATVVGVLPAGFWFPQKLDAALPLRNTDALDDTGTNTQLIARLRSDANQEIGTRMALGASAGDVLGAFVRQGFTLTTIGVLLGLVAAWFVVRSLSTLLFGVPPHDPVSFAVVALVVIAVGCAASYVPARRAATIDPLVAMRAE